MSNKLTPIQLAKIWSKFILDYNIKDWVHYSIFTSRYLLKQENLNNEHCKALLVKEVENYILRRYNPDKVTIYDNDNLIGNVTELRDKIAGVFADENGNPDYELSYKFFKYVESEVTEDNKVEDYFL